MTKDELPTISEIKNDMLNIIYAESPTLSEFVRLNHYEGDIFNDYIECDQSYRITDDFLETYKEQYINCNFKIVDVYKIKNIGKNAAIHYLNLLQELTK